MNKYFFTLLISLLSISAFSQENEIKVMYSPVSLKRIDDWGKNHDDLTANYTGAFIIDYNRYLNSRLKLGVSVTYEQGKVAWNETTGRFYPGPPYNYITTTSQHSDKAGWLFFGPQLGFDYIQKDNFRLGSLVGVSIVLDNYENNLDSRVISKGTDVNLFFHTELINFTWGKTNGLTGQLGFGHKGLVSIGYFIRW